MFTCPYLNVVITKSCQATSCSFHVQRKEFNNCMMQYSTNDSNTLSLAEVSHFCKKPYSEVKQVYNSAMQKIFGEIVKVEIDNDIPIHYLKNNLCVASESYVDTPVHLATGHIIDRSELKYPKVIWEKAIEFLTTPERLLEVLYNLFPLSTIDKFLSLPAGSARELKELIKENNHVHAG